MFLTKTDVWHFWGLWWPISLVSEPFPPPYTLQESFKSCWWVPDIGFQLNFLSRTHVFFNDINFHLFVNQSPFCHQLIDPMDCWESLVKKRQNDNFRLFRPNRAPGLIGLKTVSNRNRPLDWSSNDGLSADRWEWMKNDKPERSINRPFCHKSVNPTFSVRVWKTPIRSRNLKGRGWKLTKTPDRVSIQNDMESGSLNYFFAL